MNWIKRIVFALKRDYAVEGSYLRDLDGTWLQRVVLPDGRVAITRYDDYGNVVEQARLSGLDTEENGK